MPLKTVCVEYGDIVIPLRLSEWREILYALEAYSELPLTRVRPGAVRALHDKLAARLGDKELPPSLGW